MQFGEPTQDERRNVAVVAVVRRTVLLLRDPDIGGAVQQPLQADARLGAREWGTWAAVDTAAEREVLAGVLARRVELVRPLEAARIAVGRAVDHHDGGARTQLATADGDRGARQPEVALDGAL